MYIQGPVTMKYNNILSNYINNKKNQLIIYIYKKHIKTVDSDYILHPKMKVWTDLIEAFIHM